MFSSLLLRHNDRSEPSFQELWVPAGLHLSPELETPEGKNLPKLKRRLLSVGETVILGAHAGDPC